MTKKQRAPSKSASLKGQTPPPARQPRAKRNGGAAAAKLTAALEPRSTWRLEEAKAKFSEVVRRAHDQGPQYVTVRGKQAVAIIDAAELQRLLPPSVVGVLARSQVNLVAPDSRLLCVAGAPAREALADASARLAQPSRGRVP